MSIAIAGKYRGELMKRGNNLEATEVRMFQ